ncbi:hypothetical protein Acr_21g0005220 [Actinidia rufa]|uniref:Uncharacterized protein n=1 Tax=Actinidia rufa TaxID=165716 RepID=A0A7J0GGH7_9ERIC|nr:hypothetical protein Acr_21g0005220 [Actinidia rufa]
MFPPKKDMDGPDYCIYHQMMRHREETVNVDRVEPELDADPKTLQRLTKNEVGDETVKEMAMRKMRKAIIMMGTMERRNRKWALW